jgi:ferredoxin
MSGSTTGASPRNRDYNACSGCGLCQLVCPVWRHTRDLRFTPHGRAKALQHGASIVDIAPSVAACTFCGACEPVCPENIGLVDMVLELRRELPPSTVTRNITANMQAHTPRALVTQSASTTALVAGATYFRQQMLLARISALLGDARSVAIASDNGADISLALETGAAVPPQRIERFLAPLRQFKTIVVTDGLLLRSVRAWLPESRIVSLGESLSALAPLRRRLGAGDLYVIEPRAYHANHARLVTHYDSLRAETGCTMNLDLQRIAIPATMWSLPRRLGEVASDNSGQLAWLLKGRRLTRIVVEDEFDRRTFEKLGVIPVVHLAEVADDEASTARTWR